MKNIETIKECEFLEFYICPKCKYKFDKCVPIDYVSKRGFHHIYKDN